MRLSRDDILKAENPVEEVDLSGLPGLSGSVLVRGMTGRERDAFEISMRNERTGQRIPGSMLNIRAKIVARCVVNDDGERLFTDADIAALGEKSGAVIDRLFDVATRLSGMSEGDAREMAENFGQENGGGSSSTLPSGSAEPLKGSSAR